MSAGLVVLPLAVWVVAVAVLVYVDCAEEFLWIPILLAVAGVFSSILPLAISPHVAVVTNVAALILFIVSLAVSKKSSSLLMKHRAAMKASP